MAQTERKGPYCTQYSDSEGYSESRFIPLPGTAAHPDQTDSVAWWNQRGTEVPGLFPTADSQSQTQCSDGNRPHKRVYDQGRGIGPVRQSYGPERYGCGLHRVQPPKT